MTINGNKRKFIRINKGRNNMKCKVYTTKPVLPEQRIWASRYDTTSICLKYTPSIIVSSCPLWCRRAHYSVVVPIIVSSCPL
jgi:hypothetical protein